jgi:hypothetical protein
MTQLSAPTLVCGIALLTACSVTGTKVADTKKEVLPSFFKVDPATAGVLKGIVRFAGRKPPRKNVDMSRDPACGEAHHGKAYDESVDVNPGGTLANVFAYLKSAPIARRFIKPEVIIRVKCNIHSRMHAFIGVPGDYAIEAWQETLGPKTNRSRWAQAPPSQPILSSKENSRVHS